MKATLAIVLSALLVAAFSMVLLPTPSKAGSPEDEIEVAQQVPRSLMRQKLDHAQRLLEALSIGDFARIVSNAEELQRISLEARWTQPHSTTYAEFGDEFRRTLSRVIRDSEEQNIDGAALNYVQVILTCVQCHKLVREGEEVALLGGESAESLLRQQLDALGTGP